MDAVCLSDVGKRYLLEYRNRNSLKETFFNLGRPSRYRRREFWALEGININIPRGQAVGIIGKNGSGKTTLLKLLCRVTRPTRGRVNVTGRVAALLELGAGFQGDFTGRENIYLNGSILGISRSELDKNMEALIDFADIGDFIDAAVRTYSAGMYLRLGFAIAAYSKAEVLLIDEVLAVGDAGFQKKCLERIEAFKKEGRTIAFVSHSLDTVKHICDRAVLLENGKIADDGSPGEVVNRYLISRDDYARGKIRKDNFTGEISIHNVYFKDSLGRIVSRFRIGEEMRVVIEYNALKKVVQPVFGIGIYRAESFILGPNTRDDNYPVGSVEGQGMIEFVIGRVPFSCGEYEVSVSSHNMDESCHYDCRYRLFKFEVIPGDKNIKYGLIGIDGQWRHLE